MSVLKTPDEAVGRWGVDGVVEVGVWVGLKHGIKITSGEEETGRISVAESSLNMPLALVWFERALADFSLERYSFISSSDSPSPPQIMLLTGVCVDPNSDALNEATIA